MMQIKCGQSFTVNTTGFPAPGCGLLSVWLPDKLARGVSRGVYFWEGRLLPLDINEKVDAMKPIELQAIFLYKIHFRIELN